jgi:zinc protease
MASIVVTRLIPLFLFSLTLVLGLSADLARAQGASATTPNLDRTLPNGLRVIVFEDRRAPTALHMVWIRAGSIDETNGRTGLAHVLEHMMFKGTETLAAGEFSKRVAALGGRENAFTAREYTGYFQQVHRDALFEVMALEADRMQRLRFDDAEFVKEIQVVMEERRLRTEDSPGGLAYEALMGTAFQAHPTRNPIIGWMNDLENLTAEDARQWYETWYGPNFATVVVAGDVDSEAVFTQVESLYKNWQPKPAVDQRPQLEPPQNGMRSARVQAPAENPFVIQAWKAPTLGPGDGPLSATNPRARDVVALSMLATLLDDPDTGILVTELVRQRRIALSVSTGADGLARSPGLFTIQATPSPGTSIAQLQEEIGLILGRIAREGVSEEDLARLRRQARAAQVYQQDSLFSRAMQAGRLASMGRPVTDVSDWLKVLDTIRVDDLRRVASEVVIPSRLTVVELEPLPAGSRPAARRGFGPALPRH